MTYAFFKFCFCVQLRLLCADFTRPDQQFIAIELQKSTQVLGPILHAQ